MKENNNSLALILNPEYKLRHDKDKVLLITKSIYEVKIYGAQEEFISVIHPIHAMMLSFFNGKNFDDTVVEIQKFFEIDKAIIENTFKKLINNNEGMAVEFFNTYIHFPKNLIITMSKEMNKHTYKPEMFSYNELDVRFKRLDLPLDITFNFTTKCMTDCIYCYADRRKIVNCTIPLQRIEELIDEAKAMDLRTVNVIGGEFFLYKYWYEVLYKLKQSGFTPFLTTKIALKEDLIKKLKNLDVKSIQISLDSMIKKNLLKSIQIKAKYFYDIQETFRLLEEYDIKVEINTIISSANDSVEDIKSLEKFFLNFKNIFLWKISYGEYSIYLGENAFKQYKASRDNIELMNQYIDTINSKKLFDFNIDHIALQDNINNISLDEKKKLFEERATCTGNLWAMYILADGKVTICEELYWNPHFIIGDVTKQSLEEVWNSKKAKDLFHLKKERISLESACSTCESFEECRGDNVKQICWRDTIKAYGDDNWDFPDYRCPKAPRVEKEIFA